MESEDAGSDTEPDIAPIVGPGKRDVQSVTPAGRSTRIAIDGVVTHTPVTHVDHRGSVFEMYNLDPALGSEPVVWAYADLVRPGQVKGWARHEHKDDRYTLITGEALIVLHDDRPESPTMGVSQQVVLSARATRQLFIPRGVWHISVNLADGETCLVNFPTAVYDHANPDRYLLAWDSKDIPVDIAGLLPKA